jgi:hypothetical protein
MAGTLKKSKDDYHLKVILRKRKPSFAWVATVLNAPKIPSASPLGDEEAELPQFAMNLGSSPVGVLFCMRRISTLNLFADLRSAAARPGAPAQ